MVIRILLHHYNLFWQVFLVLYIQKHQIFKQHDELGNSNHKNFQIHTYLHLQSRKQEDLEIYLSSLTITVNLRCTKQIHLGNVLAFLRPNQ